MHGVRLHRLVSVFRLVITDSYEQRTEISFRFHLNYFYEVAVPENFRGPNDVIWLYPGKII